MDGGVRLRRFSLFAVSLFEIVIFLGVNFESRQF